MGDEVVAASYFSGAIKIAANPVCTKQKAGSSSWGSFGAIPKVLGAGVALKVEPERIENTVEIPEIQSNRKFSRLAV